MRHHLFYLFVGMMLALTSCGTGQLDPMTFPETPEAKPTKVLVACFSFTGNTRTVAATLAGLTEGTLHLITPETAYGSENNNYYDESTRAYQEQYGPATARPAIQKTLTDAADYDIILLGFPIWYGKAPRVVFSFLDAYGFKGKKVIPFITSGSSGIGAAETELRSAYPDIVWKSGARLNGKSQDELAAWLRDAG